MIHYDEKNTPRTRTDNTDVVLIRTTLQQATDDYPRLAALGFTLQHANSHPGGDMQQNRAQLLRFHAETYCRIGEYAKARTNSGKLSPPTLLRWLWEEKHTSTCRMIMLFNLGVCCSLRHDVSPDEEIQAMISLLMAAWRDVEPGGKQVEMTEYRAERTKPVGFGKHYSALWEAALRMASPVVYARSCSNI
ncbi:hypothetical protein [Buttiauxella sp. S04-F03]|uniref:hypothetical protein n=1 Tax=Buttiauxella sp. S04-F03 TaxID=2904525 RepID=UPI001E36BE82|nr:hypothetical protein [Buttiauxella sp. S04-F03]MCE0814109.1 hypothetical protein [Buttiauxella sp. S04-F03]